MTRHVILRHVNMRILEVILMVVQEILTKNIKMKKRKITLTLQLKKRYNWIEITRINLKAVIFNIDNHEKEILAVCYENKRIQTKDKWNQLNLVEIQSLLGTNHRLPLYHMAKSYIWLEEKNKRINEFSIGYTMNQNLNTNKVFREQVKVFMKTTFSESTMTKISRILLKPNTRVLALVMFFQNRKKCKENVQSVELCNIYNYKQLFLYWIFRFWEKKLSYLRLSVAGN